MPIRPVLFEDHLVPSFRPLAWSQPLFEFRCGMFNPRERVEIGCERTGNKLSSSNPGGLLGRRTLAPLNQSPNWIADPARLKKHLEASRDSVLLINGRLAARFDILDVLLNSDAIPQFAWFDGDTLIAAHLSSAPALQILDSWSQWEDGVSESGAWSKPGVEVPKWDSSELLSDRETHELPHDQIVHCDDPSLVQTLTGWAGDERALLLNWIWEIVPYTAGAIASDLPAAAGVKDFRRQPFGIEADPSADAPQWRMPMSWEAGRDFGHVHCTDTKALWTAPGVQIAPFVSIDTEAGPVVLDRGVSIRSHVHLEGPLYLGPGSIVKEGARIYGESSFGIGCRVAGEIAESTFGDFANKQHAGFIGHAVLGSWINLGAMTTCSDLKNNYGDIRVDLGQGTVNTGLRFVGLMLGDHAKTAIGTLFNTGTCVGFASNIFGGVMPPKFVGNFSWGGEADAPLYSVERAVDTAAIVMSRRGCRMNDAHRRLFKALSE